jgi:hypothetical protein
MRNLIAITPLRDCLPAQRSLLPAAIATIVSTIFLGLPGAADARGKGKPAPVTPLAVTTPVVPARTTTMATTMAATAPASLRAANDSVAPKAAVEVTTTGSLRGGATVGKAAGAATANAVADDLLPSATPQRPRDWYPESHSYLRPYHYKWRYWTPG